MDTYNIFGDAPDIESDDHRICHRCGTTVRDLHVDGRMGCAECYRVFAKEVHRAILVLHGANLHIGKALGETG